MVGVQPTPGQQGRLHPYLYTPVDTLSGPGLPRNRWSMNHSAAWLGSAGDESAFRQAVELGSGHTAVLSPLGLPGPAGFPSLLTLLGGESGMGPPNPPIPILAGDAEHQIPRNQGCAEDSLAWQPSLLPAPGLVPPQPQLPRGRSDSRNHYKTRGWKSHWAPGSQMLLF